MTSFLEEEEKYEPVWESLLISLLVSCEDLRVSDKVFTETVKIWKLETWDEGIFQNLKSMHFLLQKKIIWPLRTHVRQLTTLKDSIPLSFAGTCYVKDNDHKLIEMDLPLSLQL